jgi:YD repeat-containing protein
VRARNALGWGAATSVTATRARAPDAPAGVVTERLNQAVRVTWPLPGDGGAPLTGQLATAGAVVAPALPDETARIVTGLQNGTPRSLTVAALNRVGPGPAGTGLPDPVTPARHPDRPVGPPSAEDPTRPLASDGDASATVTWAPPPDAGGALVTSFVIRTLPDAAPLVVPDATATQATVQGLQNGLEYVLVVTAVNDVGAGEESLFSNPVTPARPPDAPRFVTAVPTGDRTLRLSWQRPWFDGGASIERWLGQWRCVDCTDPTWNAWQPFANDNPHVLRRTLVLPEACKLYELQVWGWNRKGDGATGTVGPVAAPTLPRVPVITSATGAHETVTVAWSPPVPDMDGIPGDGCSPILWYVVRILPPDAPDVEVPATSPLTATFAGLQNGTEYAVRVAAVNAIGTGPEADQHPVVPCGVPFKPLDVQAAVGGDRRIVVTWRAPAWNGGCPVTGYVVQGSGEAGTSPLLGAATLTYAFEPPPHVLSPGEPYTFWVRATNAVGFGPDSDASTAVVAATCPDPPPHTPVPAGEERDRALPFIEVQPGDELLRACWRPPDSDGYSPVTGHDVLVTPPPSAGANPAHVDAPETCVVVTNLTNGVPYTVQVRTINAACASDWAGPSDAVTPHEAHLAEITIVPATQGAGGGAMGYVRLDGIAPLIAGYDVTVASLTPAVAWPVPQSPLTVHVDAGESIAGFPIATSGTVAVQTAVTFTATDAAGGYTAALTVEPRAAGECAAARIESPAETADIWDHDTFVEVSVEGSGVLAWSLHARLASGADWELLASGTTPVTGQSVRFDPTLRLNGLWDLKLTASYDDDLDGDVDTTCVDSRRVVVRGEQKVGQFTLAYADLTIPLANLPIQLTRTYDSRDKRLGDFGVGWRLSISDVRLERNIPTGDRWDHVNHTGPSWVDWPTYCMEEIASHVVTVTFPTGKVYTFKPVFDWLRGSARRCSETNITQGFIRFEPTGPTRGELRAIERPPYLSEDDLDDADDLDDGFVVVVTGGGDDPVELMKDPLDDIPWDPVEYELTLENGIVYRLTVADTPSDQPAPPGVPGRCVKWIQDRNGNRITITNSSITMTPSGAGAPVASVPLVRDGQDRILEIRDLEDGDPLQPAGRVIHYVYGDDVDPLTGDPAPVADVGDDDLWRVYDRVQWAKQFVTPLPLQPIPVEHAYHATPAHHLRRVVDPSGNRPVRCEYGTDGRLLRVCDGSGFDPADPPASEEPGRCVDLSTRSLDDHTQTILDRRGNPTLLTYDEHGMVTQRLDAVDGLWLYAYNDHDEVVSEQDPVPSTTETQYDSRGHVTLVEEEVSDTEVVRTRFTWTAKGDLLSTQLGDDPDHTWTYVVSPRGNPVSDADPLGHGSTYTVDAQGNVTDVLDALGHATSSTYLDGYLRSETDAVGITTLYTTTRNGQVRTTRRYRLDALGNVVWVDGSGTRYDHDANDRVTRTYLPDDTPDDWTDNAFTETV